MCGVLFPACGEAGRLSFYMTAKFRLQFRISKIRSFASRYEYAGRDAVDAVLRSIPAVKKRGYLRKKDLEQLAYWKSSRSSGRVKRNDGSYVKAVTQFALKTSDERARIEVLTSLDGVGWPTASSILHFFHRSPYPILDFRALESLSVEVPRYTFSFWWDYVDFCRKLSRRAKVDMRTLDRALWQFSKENGD